MQKSVLPLIKMADSASVALSALATGSFSGGILKLGLKAISTTATIKANAKTTARFNEYGLAPAYGPRHIGSGPGFVTKDNIGKVEKYAGQFR